MSMAAPFTIQPPRFSIALISASTLAYEILLMRLFSIIQWHHFAYMIISLALLGYGASGTFLALNSQRLLRNYPLAFVSNVLLFGISCLVCYLLAQQIPLNAQEILWDGRQSGFLLSLYLLLALPFFFAANAIGLALMTYRQHIYRLYAADLFGAGIGSIGIVLLLFIAFPADSLRVITAIAVAAAALACWEMRLANKVKWLLLPGAIIPLLLPASWTELTLSPYKTLSQILHINGAEVIAEHSSPLGLLSIVESPLIPLRHAPGLSLNAGQEPPPQLGVFTDGDAMTVITQNPDTPEFARTRFNYLDQLTSALPYHLKKPQQVLILGAGGGSDVLQARYHNVEDIEAVELNPQMVKLVQEDYRRFAGGLYDADKIQLHIAEARGFISGSQRQYDLIQVALLDGFSASAAGLYALSESYLYTVEALQQYLAHLKPGGFLAISRWVKLPPRDTLKLFASAIAALEQQDLGDVAQRLVLIRGWQTSTLLIKNGAFAAEEITALQQFCEQRAFDLAYYPDMPASQANRFNRLREPLFYQAAQALLGTQRASFLADYKFNIQPATDDRPYFFNFFKWQVLPEILALKGKGGLPLLEWGYLVLVATLLQALLVSLVLIILPLVFMRQAPTPTQNSPFRRWQAFVYFLALGLAFLFIEIAFIQKFILFLHHPLYAVAVVLAAFLIFAGLGSAYSKRYSQDGKHSQGITIAVGGIMVLGMVYVLGLGPLFSVLLDLPAAAKVLITIGLIAPLAFCMGLPFPLGLSLVADNAKHLIPWVWGVNGCASVLSAVLATLLAIHFGFTAVVLLALLLYGVAALVLGQPWPTRLPKDSLSRS